MTVIFATNIPFIRQHEIDMYLDDIAQRYPVLRLDLSPMYHREDDKVSDCVRDRVMVSSPEELDAILDRCLAEGGAVFITNIILSRLSAISQRINAKGIPIVNINKEGLAAWFSHEGARKHPGDQPLQYRLKILVNSHGFLRKTYKRLRFPGVKYDYLLSSYDFFPEERRSFVHIHNIKYDEYTKALESERPFDGEYILFVDAALAGHPMFEKASDPLDRDYYIGRLNDYFGQLEACYGIPVVISAHPKANYGEGDFQGRQIIKYRTPQLVQHAKYIVSHYSTSLVNAVLARKPIVVMTSRKLEHCVVKPSVFMGIAFAELLGLRIVDLDHPDCDGFAVNEQRYDEFIEKYVINKEQASRSNGELIVGFLQTLEKNNKG